MEPILIHGNDTGSIAKIATKVLDGIGITTYTLHIPYFKYIELCNSYRNSNSDIIISSVIDVLDDQWSLPGNVHAVKTKGKYWLPIDIHQRLVKLREDGPFDLSEFTYNKTMSHVMFNVDKLDTLNHDELVDILLEKWSQIRVIWLFKLLGYPAYISHSAMLNFKYVSCKVFGNIDDARYRTMLTGLTLDNVDMIEKVTEYIGGK